MKTLTRSYPMSQAERVAVRITCAAMAGFGVFGLATGAPSTFSYLVSVVALGLLITRFRSTPIPGPLAIALAIHAVLHLAGGLVRVGNDVLYNASITQTAFARTHILQYDHVVHAFGTFVGTLTLWTLLVAPASIMLGRRESLVLCLLAGLGIGCLNETIEFLATIAHSGAHVGGYTNTGWDLISNTVGALAAARVIQSDCIHTASSP